MNMISHTRVFRIRICFLLYFVIFLNFACKHEKQEVIPQQEVENQHEGKDFSVDKDLAMKVALNFSKSKSYAEEVNKNAARNGRSISFPGFEDKDVEEILVIPDDLGKPALFVVKFTPKGYIIISATKKISPIQGYSTDSKFNIKNLPGGLTGWFLGRISKIRTIKYDKNSKAPITISSMWTSNPPPDDGNGNSHWDPPSVRKYGDGRDVFKTTATTSTTEEGVFELLKTKWGQGKGYNHSIPKDCTGNDYGGKPPTGCVATALAQIMKYHSHPWYSQIKGTRYYHNWSIMQDRIKDVNNLKGGDLEIAELMSVLGYRLNMNYGCSASSTTIKNIPYILKSCYNYSNTVRHDGFNLGLIIDELNNKRPVLLRGDRDRDDYLIFYVSRNGHAWVCDGWKKYKYITETTHHTYDSKYTYKSYSETYSGVYLHFNWGWDGVGQDDNNNGGWFRHDRVSLNYSTYDKYSNVFQYDRRMVIGIKPAN